MACGHRARMEGCKQMMYGGIQGEMDRFSMEGAGEAPAGSLR